MGSSGNHWDGLATIDPDSDKYERIQRILSTANFDFLKECALKLRRRRQSNLAVSLSCDINLARFTSGFQNLVMELAFSDCVSWIARIPYHDLDTDGRTSMLSEIATMKIVKGRTTIPIPEVFAFEVSADQPFGYSYVLMECLEGQRLPGGIAASIPRHHHSKVAKQLANVFAELQDLTFTRIGRIWCGDDAAQPAEIIAMAWHSTPGPLETSLEYFYNQRQGENREILGMQQDDPDWLTACWVMKNALTHIIVEDRVRGPFPLCHLDMHFGNMLFDNEYNLTGIIDWSSAQAAPMEQLSVCPEFATFPALSDEENRPTVELKSLVIDALKEIEALKSRSQPLDDAGADMDSDQGRTPLSTYMASKSAEITYRLYMASPRAGLWVGKVVSNLIYGDSVTWGQLREVYGHMPIF